MAGILVNHGQDPEAAPLMGTGLGEVVEPHFVAVTGPPGTLLRGQRPQPEAGPYITYIFTGEGWHYLAAILDLYPRYVVGWSMAGRMNRRLVLDALGMAVGRRRPGLSNPLASQGRRVEFIEVFYNRGRRHSALGFAAPAEYEVI